MTTTQSTMDVRFLDQENDQLSVWNDHFDWALTKTFTNGNEHLHQVRAEEATIITDDATGQILSINGREVEAVYEVTGRAILVNGTQIEDAKMTVAIVETFPKGPADKDFTAVVLHNDDDIFSYIPPIGQFDALSAHEEYTNDHCPVPCFAPHTRILTADGYKEAGALTTNDTLITSTGEETKIVWTGSRHVSPLNMQRHQKENLPIHIAKSALADNCPAADMIVSRQHRIAFTAQNGQESLIAAGKLAGKINGITIAQDYVETGIEYVHFATQNGHDIIIAEGTACESLYVKGEELERIWGAQKFSQLMDVFQGAVETVQDAAPIAQNFKPIRALEKSGRPSLLTAQAAKGYQALTQSFTAQQSGSLNTQSAEVPAAKTAAPKPRAATA